MKSLKKHNCQDFIILNQYLKLSSQDKHPKRYPPLEGILAKPGYIHKWLSYNQFEPKLTKIGTTPIEAQRLPKVAESSAHSEKVWFLVLCDVL